MTAPDPRLGEIEARLAAASIHDGPWAVEEDDWGCKVYVQEPGFGTMYICEDMNQQGDGRNDAEFIANAPTDLAYLLAELRTAREALARVEGLCIEWEVKYGPGSKADAILGPQKVSIKHAVTTFRAAVAAADGNGHG